MLINISGSMGKYMNNKATNISRSDRLLTLENTKGIKTLLGEPKKAVIKLSIPMIIAMSVTTIYNFVDTLWVSGFGANWFPSSNLLEVGADAVAAVGFVLPFFMTIISISTGLGVGCGSAISRRIGANDKKGVDNVAIHSIILTILTAIIFTIPLFLYSNIIFTSIGALEAASMATSYGQIIFAGSIFLFFSYIANAILRGEGDAKRAMYAMMFGAGLNIFLDPVFIYIFRLGVTGAAYATVLSMAITSSILIYWLFFRKNTYVAFSFHDFKFNKEILIDIFRVGLPASIQQLSMSFTMLILIFIITFVSGDKGVTIYTIGWRVLSIAILPLLGMATAVVSVGGAAYGAHKYVKIKTVFLYSIKISLIIEIILAVSTFFLAPIITSAFTTFDLGLRILSGDVILFLQISCLFYPGAAFGIMASSIFQGTGKGTYALICTLLRTIILVPVFAFLFSYIFNLGLVGIWYAIVIANIIGSIVSFTWCKLYIRNLIISNDVTI